MADTPHTTNPHQETGIAEVIRQVAGDSLLKRIVLDIEYRWLTEAGVDQEDAENMVQVGYTFKEYATGAPHGGPLTEPQRTILDTLLALRS